MEEEALPEETSQGEPRAREVSNHPRPQPRADEVMAEPEGEEEGVQEETGTVERERRVRVARRPQLSSEGLEYDAMYISPLDSSLQLFLVGLAVVFLASLATRLYRISEPDHVA